MRQRLFWIIAALVFVPNCVFILGMWLLDPQSSFLSTGARVGWLLVLVLVAVLVGSLLTSTLLRPLTELTRAVAYMRGTQRTLADLSLPRPSEPPPLEIAELRSGIEELLVHIKELLEAREALYATLAHDLKTPLLAGMRALEYLERADAIGAEQRKQLLHELWLELSGSYQLVENLLTASRMENQRPQPEPVLLLSVLENMRLRFQRRAAEKGVTLEVGGFGQARADKYLLERALSNLIENALRFARTRVVLRCGEGWVEVEDDGPGLQEPLEQLSQPFRSQRLRGIRAGSAGLGLFIVRRVAELHGGSLRDAPGTLGGACLRVKLG
ncbi:sensor histidine kinase [Calidithermus chliarophilus]|uniref:sensor histidine kinase n=1 Tax=Calidithermus chliarophilus TaxID=52023 RepID=UPI000415F62C|nr:HAMP domain-containing sensor histidine kinase [Calidithermus chliarophilus]